MNVSVLDPVGPVSEGRRRSLPRRHPPRLLQVSVIAVTLIMVTPLIFLLLEARSTGVARIGHLIARPLTVTLLFNTVRLTVVVTVLCAVIGTATAWCVERTDLPLRRVWAVLVVLPFAIPDFVVSFGWASLFTWVHGFVGAVIVMTLAVYPLVFLPVAASFRSADPGLEEAARTLGLSRVATFFRVTLAQARGAILGGCVLVALMILAEYGAFEILGFRTFTTEIFSEFSSFSVPTACALSLVLVLLGAILLFGDAAARSRGRSVRTGAFAQRVARRTSLGRATAPVLVGFATLVALALGVPVGSSVYWMVRGSSAPLGGVSLWDAGWHTAIFAALAAAFATAFALPVAALAVRHDNRWSRLYERSSFIVMAMPGLVIALALSYFSEHYAHGFAYQTSAMLITAYALLFFPLALVSVRTSIAFAPPRLEDVARSLGTPRWRVFTRVTVPLVGPGLAASFSLVFLAVVTELTATLLLAPLGVYTLSTQFWAYEQNLSYGQAAPFALVMIGLAAVPTYVLVQFFDRRPTRSGEPA